jgi:Na+-transporting methylmalonyl-CoA/oxaloacetate decarboxylase gamma subunit
MDKDSAIILIVGLGLTFGFLGFLAYLIAQGRQQFSSTAPATVYIPTYAPKEVDSTKTEEVAPTKPHIMNHILNDASTWYEIPIPKDIRTWSMNARGAYDILYAFEPSHSTYRTLFSGMFIDSDTAPNNVNKIYVSSATAGAVVEVLMFR